MKNPAQGSKSRAKPPRERRRKTPLPGALEKLVRQALPDGVVERQGSADESWFGDVEEELRSRLAQLAGAGLVFERPPDPESPDSDDNSDDLPLDSSEHAHSYHLFFIAASAPWARADVEEEQPVEPWKEEEPGEENGERPVRVKGSQQVGCAVGISLLAPVGLVIDPHQHFAQLYKEEALSALFDLERSAAEVLTSMGIRVLSAEEAAIEVPFLRVGEACLGEPVRLQDAFFFTVP